jgi:GDPmannose 4,6-dehydratase
MKKRALITGLTGQDGSYLSEFLIKKGYDVYGLMRRTSTDSTVRLSSPEHKKIKILYGDLRDFGALMRAVETANPDEIYNLAAQSDVGISFKCPEEAIEINYLGVGRLLNAAKKIKPKVRIYQASTSEMFGKTTPPQNESSPFLPVSPYGEAKLRAHQDFVEGYRKKHGLFICSGFLFNHESPRRGHNFVTRKITRGLASIKLGRQEFVELGNMDAKRDWGFAGDYVEAMWKMLQQKNPEDFVIATGESHTVREFAEEAARALRMEIHWEGKGSKEVGKDKNGKTIIKINKEFYRPLEVDYLLGDSTKANKKLGWKPKTTFKELAKMMALADYATLKKERH